MPSSQAAATERRSDRMMTHEPPKLKTTLKTPPKQATNPLQFVKVGPCSLYRTAQEQLQKVQEVKKIKQEVRDDPEDWQSNLDNWKSSRRKRQEHIIERVVEVKKLELEEHDRQRRRSKTFSEMMEERGSRGRKLSMSLAMYHEEDSNDLSDLGIGTSSGKSSVSGDTHDDTQSVLSDRDSEIDKNHSDLDNVTNENGNSADNNNLTDVTNTSIVIQTLGMNKKPFGNGFHNDHDQREYDSGTTATVSSPEPEEYTYEGAIRGYVSRVSQNIPRRSLANLDVKLDNFKTNLFEEKISGDEKSGPVVKVDILKRREIFEKALQKTTDNKTNNNRSSGDFSNTKSIKERLSNLEKQKQESEQMDKNTKSLNRLSGDMSSIRERLSHLEKQAAERESKISRKPSIDELEPVRPLRERLSTLEKYASSDESSSPRTPSARQNGRCKEVEKKAVDKQMLRFNKENSTPSERSSSPDSEYRAPRTAFHRSLDSLDADASSGPDTFERVQSLEELDYTQRYPASGSSAELLNDTDREDSGIHTADVSCSVSQADEPVDEEIVHQQPVIIEAQKIQSVEQPDESPQLSAIERKEEVPQEKYQEKVDSQQSAVITEGTAEAGKLSTNKIKNLPDSLNPTTSITTGSKFSMGRTVIYQSPRVPPRRSPPEIKSDSSNANLSEQQPSTKTEVDTEAKNPTSTVKTLDTKESISIVNKPSKIPTPLPRKPVNVKINSGTASSSSTPPSSPAKIIPQPKLCSKSPTKIPSPLKCQPDDSNQSEIQEKNNERRRTVVEVCEKIVVPPGGTPPPPVTPFIMVNEESILIGSGSVDEEEIEVPRAESTTSVEHEKEEVCTSDSKVEMQTVESPVTTRTNVEQETEIQIESDTTPVVTSIVSLSGGTESNHLTFEKPVVTAPNTMEFISTLSPLSKQIPPLNLTSDEEIVAGLTFPLGPPSSVEPPKEKPPPPPTDFSDEENQPIEPLKRLNSTRRIKKELRTRRSDFLGIEGINDDDLELSLAKPPDMAAILAEERRIEQLHRRSYDTDSNYEQDSSHERDSGVELGHVDDWVKQPVSPDMSQHSRQSSEPFGASVTSSEEDEITKKEREIIEVLEKEEQWRYGSDREQNSDIGEKLADKLRELEEEKMQLERERQKETLRKNDENARKQEEETLRKQQEAVKQQEAEEKKLREEEQLRLKAEQLRIHDEMMESERRTAEIRKQEEIRLRTMEGQIREQEKTVLTAVQYNHEDEYTSGEVLRVERELLQLEQEELKRQRTNMAYREQKQQQLAEQLQEQWQSLQDVNHGATNNSHATYQNINIVNYRSSMPNLQLQDSQRRRVPPPPIPPAKPLRLLDQRHRDATIRNSRIPSADSIPQQVDASLRHSVSATTLVPHAGQQMTKQTLQALSAVPRTRIVKNDQWVQRRKSDGPRITQDYNYQHWLIQEAEQRRINEKNQRSPARKPQQHVTGTSVPYAATSSKSDGKPLPDSIIQTLTQRIQNRAQERPPPIRRRLEHSVSQEHLPLTHHQPHQHLAMMHQKVHQSSGPSTVESQEKMLSVSGKKKCSHCGDELGRGAAMIIESLRLFYHMECFKCCVCHVRLGDGLMGTDVRVRNHKLHCHNCYSSDDGVKFSCV